MALFSRRHLMMAALIAACSPLTAWAGSALDQARFPDVNGKPQSVENWRGKVVVVNFWATWCAPCREEMPMLNTFSQRFGPHGVAVVGIALDQKIPVKNFAQQFSITYPLLVADNSALELMRTIGNKIGALPFTVVLDRDGNITARLTGKITEQNLLDAVKPRL